MKKSSKFIIDRKSKENLKKFFKILSRYKKEWIGAAFLLLIVTLMKLPMPILTGYIIDNVIQKNNPVLLNYLCGGLILVTILYLVISYIKDYVLFCVQNAIVIRIRLMLFEHIQDFTMTEITKKETGYLLARILNDPESLNGLFFQTIFGLAQSIITLIVGITVIFSINWRLAILSLAILPFFAGSNFLFIKKIKYWDNQIKEKDAVISKELNESLSALKVTKLFLLFKNEAIKFLRNLKEQFGFSRKQFNFEYVLSTAAGFFAAMGPLVVVWYGGHEVINGNLTIGQLVAFSSLLGFLYNPTKSILSIHVLFQKSLVSLNRIFDILDIPVEEETASLRAEKFSHDNFNIIFKDVSFCYNDSVNVLDNINLSIKEGERVAILGPTGVGKSTLVHLLAGFFEPAQGTITIGGKEIQEISLPQLRRNIGFVTQEDFLFSTTIYNNIKIGNLKADHDDIIKAAKLANAYPFIRSLPDGIYTIVGQEGEYLSGGQKQLICMARIILKNPPILILDEPTSAIDSTTEKLMQESLLSFMENRTTIIISHRLSSILNVDRIVILENGKISSIGTHEQLITRNKFYTGIFESQVERIRGKK